MESALTAARNGITNPGSMMPKPIQTGTAAMGLSLLCKGLSLGTIVVGLLVGGIALHYGVLWHSLLLQGVALSIIAGSFFVAIFTWREVGIRMQQNSALLLSDALRETLRGYAFYLSFVPVIGNLFTRFVDPSERKNPFVADSDRER